MKSLKLLTLIIFTFILMSIFVLPIQVDAMDVNVRIDGKEVTFTNESGHPFVDNVNRALVPLRQTMEAFGCYVTWDEKSKSAFIIKDGIEVCVTVGKNYILKDGVKIENDTSSIIREGRIYLPIRVVVEAFNASVYWDSVIKCVEISSPKSYSLRYGADGFTDATRPIKNDLPLSNINNTVDFRKYLEQNIGDIDTPMGKMSIRMGDIEIFDTINKEPVSIYFWIRLDSYLKYNTPGGNIQLFTYGEIPYVGTFTKDERQETIDALKELSLKIAGYTKEAFPKGTIFCSFVDTGYKYPNLRIGYSSSEYYSWKMVDQELTWYDDDEQEQAGNDYYGL